MGLYFYPDLLHGGTLNVIDEHHRWNFSFKPSYLGFVLSVLLTAGMYFFITHHHLHGKELIWAICMMGTVQALIQLVFFLHLGMESKPHWNTITFLFAALVIIVVVGGSLWIMQNLNYNLMPTMHHGSG